MYRLSYFSTVRETIEFNVEKKHKIPHFDIAQGPVSALALEKWDGTAFITADIWAPEYYDIVNGFVESMPAPKRLMIANVAQSGNLASSVLSDLIVAKSLGDCEFYPILSRLEKLSFVNINESDSFTPAFLIALSESSIHTLELTNVEPLKPLYHLLAEKMQKKTILSNLKSLSLENVSKVPVKLPHDLTRFSFRNMNQPFPTLPLSLTCLDLSHNNVCDLKKIASAIKNCTLLEILILDGNNFKPCELAHIFRLPNLKRLKNISAMGVAPLKKEEIDLLLHALEKNTALCDLDLSPVVLDTRLRNRLNLNNTLAEPSSVKRQLRVIENIDGETFDIHRRNYIESVAHFFGV